MASLAIALCAPAAEVAELWRQLAGGCEGGDGIDDESTVEEAIEVGQPNRQAGRDSSWPHVRHAFPRPPPTCAPTLASPL